MPAWRGTPALLRGAVAGAGLVTAGVVLRRVELVFLGVPLVLSTVVALAAGRRGEPRVTTTADPTDPAVVTVAVDGGHGAELVAIRLPSDPEALGTPHLLAGPAPVVQVRLPRTMWGEGLDLRPDHLVAGPDGLVVWGPVVGAQLRRTLLPPVDARAAGPLRPRSAGLVGVHRAPRPGDGAELRAIRPFQPGDRVRRVDWRVSLRAGAAVGELLTSGTLHVREHHAEADADLMLVLDERHDAVATIAEWAAPPAGSRVRPGGSVDVAVRAMCSCAAEFLRQGDRVGLALLGNPQLGVVPGGGHRQLQRIRYRLARAADVAGHAGAPVTRQRPVPAGAAVLLFSPFLDEAAVEFAVRTARRGHAVFAVDVLRGPLVPDRSDAWGPAACVVLDAEHRMRLAVLRAHGVAVLGPDEDLAAVLRAARRARTATRVRS